jgi:hypothetical protein
MTSGMTANVNSSLSKRTARVRARARAVLRDLATGKLNARRAPVAIDIPLVDLLASIAPDIERAREAGHGIPAIREALQMNAQLPVAERTIRRALDKAEQETSR